MKKKMKHFIISALLVGTIGLVGNTAFAATFGDACSGASSQEILQIKYEGAAWNYSCSPYLYTAFEYSRNGKVLLKKNAYNGIVTGFVWDDLLWGEMFTTKFRWWRGPLK